MAPVGKTVLSAIADGGKRRLSIKKRIKGLKKKVHEMSVLCNVDAAMVIYDPEKDEHTVYPEETEKATPTILKYLSTNGAERLAKTETAKNYFEKKRQKKMVKANKLNKEVEKLSGEVILTKITDGELTFEEINADQKKMVAKFLATLKAQVVAEITKKEKEGNADGLNQVAPLLADPADGGAQSSDMMSAVVCWPYLPEQVEAMSATELLQEVLQDDATTDKQMPPTPFNNIAPLVPPMSQGDTRNGILRAMNYHQPFPSIWPQSHQLGNTPWRPQMWQSFPRPRNQLPLLPPHLQPASAQLPPLPPQLQPASAQLPPLPPQLQPASAQLPPLPPQLGPASAQLPPLPPQLELPSQLPPLPQAGLMSHDFFPPPLRGQLAPLPPQQPLHPHQLVPRSLELFAQPSQLQIRGNTNMRSDAPTLRGFAPYRGAVNHTSKKN